MKYTNTWSLGPLPRQSKQRCKQTNQWIQQGNHSLILIILVLTLPAHLSITFPLALALSPFSTARKFCGVTFYRKHPNRSHKLFSKPSAWTFLKTSKTHISSVVFGNTFVHIRAIWPVYHYPRGGVPRKNNKEGNEDGWHNINKADESLQQQDLVGTLSKSGETDSEYTLLKAPLLTVSAKKNVDT